MCIRRMQILAGSVISLTVRVALQFRVYTDNKITRSSAIAEGPRDVCLI